DRAGRLLALAAAARAAARPLLRLLPGLRDRLIRFCLALHLRLGFGFGVGGRLLVEFLVLVQEVVDGDRCRRVRALAGRRLARRLLGLALGRQRLERLLRTRGLDERRVGDTLEDALDPRLHLLAD